MKIIYILLLSPILTQKYSLDLLNLRTGVKRQTESYILFDKSNINDFTFDYTQILEVINSDSPGNFVIEFKNKNGKKLKSFLNNENNSLPLKGLVLEIIRNTEGQIISIFPQKSFKNFNPKNVVIRDAEVIKEDVQISFSSLNEPHSHNMPGTEVPGAEPPKPEKEKSFFKRYFWWIVIGGFLVMNIMKMDKTKLQNAYDKSQQQAQAHRQTVKS